ncbi:MAG: hypothetical protein ABSB41_05795 [Anaerolineales bacterium]
MFEELERGQVTWRVGVIAVRLVDELKLALKDGFVRITPGSDVFGKEGQIQVRPGG